MDNLHKTMTYCSTNAARRLGGTAANGRAGRFQIESRLVCRALSAVRTHVGRANNHCEFLYCTSFPDRKMEKKKSEGETLSLRCWCKLATGGKESPCLSIFTFPFQYFKGKDHVTLHFTCMCVYPVNKIPKIGTSPSFTSFTSSTF